ncbi:hypothetical protein DPMN_193405 [Dreissena polymorpha]|uniref:Uncharacterized protein n=1 Tax=Dreissena polymorpha TaxID=45954 RepID=A0A9D3Y7A6_DREPO|nr:hypothetical protein DPMN_193405 [Dreissena polymorpha]
MGTIIKISPDNIKTNVLTKCHKDWAKCMSTRVVRVWWSFGTGDGLVVSSKRKNALPLLARKNALPPLVAMFFNRRETFGNSAQTSLLTRKNAPPTTILEQMKLTRKNAPPPWRPCISTDRTQFHEDWTKHLTSRKNALPPGGHMKNAPPPGGHIFQQTRTIFEIIHNIISTIVLTKFHEDLTINMTSKVLTRKKGAPGLVMGPCIVEIDRIVIREVQYQLEVNLCRNEEIIVKDNFGWVWPIMGGAPKAEIDHIVIREVQYQFEVNRCRNEEIIVKDNFWLAWPMWPGRPRIDRIVIREAQYQFEVNQCRNEEVNEQTHITTISPLFLRKTWG